jgi:DNA replication and repair protein RecF
MSPLAVNQLSVQSITLSHFRNYASLRLTLSPEPVVLIGPNGAGKTNLLEAVSLLTPGRGLRRATLADMDNERDDAPWAVAAEVQGLQGMSSIGTGRDGQNGEETDKRIVKIDGKTTRGQAELARTFAALWLTPQMDTLFLEGGTARRKFLDRLVYSFDAEHASRINAYEFAMRERNRLLGEGRRDAAWLGALEQKMAEQGMAIAVARAHAVEGLNQSVLLAKHSFPQAMIAVTGLVEAGLQESSALAAEEKFRDALAASRMADAGAGRTLVGVHRAVVDVVHVAKNMPAERCSTGEQKALLVSIILAQVRAGAAWHGTVPVLLLDEVVAHLDSIRRKELYAELADIGAQAWLTGTDADVFEGLAGQFFRVENGNIVKY